MKLKINNQIINLEKANTPIKRLVGFMFQRNISTALVFKTKSIHTFFMKENIDVIITNKDNITIDFKKNLEKNKIIFNKNAYYIYELPNNFIKNLKKGDKLELIN